MMQKNHPKSLRNSKVMTVSLILCFHGAYNYAPSALKEYREESAIQCKLGARLLKQNDVNNAFYSVPGLGYLHGEMCKPGLGGSKGGRRRRAPQKI